MSPGAELKPRLTHRDAVDPGQRLLDQHRIGEGDRGAQQRALDLLAVPGFAALDQSAASVPKADRQAVPKSTHGTLLTIGCSGVPER